MLRYFISRLRSVHWMSLKKTSVKKNKMIRKAHRVSMIKIFTVVILIFTSGTLDSSLAAVTQIREGKTIRLGGYFYVSGFHGRNQDMSLEELTWAANNLDILSFAPSVTKDTIKKMKQINENLRIYYMTYATTLYEIPPYGWPAFDAKSMQGWVLKYKNGEEATGIRRKKTDSNAHIMDLGSAQWADFFKKYAAKLTKERAVNGVAIDEIMWEGYWGANREQLAKYTSVDQISDSCYEWLKRIAIRHEFDIIHQAYWDQAQQYANGIWGELAFYAWEDTEHSSRSVFYKKMNWEQIVKNLEQYSSGRRTYIWAAWYKRDNKEQLLYSLATYLLGKQSDSAVFQPQPLYGSATAPNPNNFAGYMLDTMMQEYEKNRNLFDVELGAPTEKVTKISTNDGGQYWRRKFAKGLVVCNPSATSTISIFLEKAMLDITGEKTQTIILRPRSGAILTDAK